MDRLTGSRRNWRVLPWSDRWDVDLDTEFDGDRYRNLCCDVCRVNLLEIGEYYMLKDNLWQDQLGLGWNSNLCIGCLESRLGRTINFDDLIIFRRLSWMKPDSIRLTQRMASKADRHYRPRTHRIKAGEDNEFFYQK
jgi:hypothetical protein